MKYLLDKDFRIIPVNPGQAGKEILGQKVYSRVADLPAPVDMVDIFPPIRKRRGPSPMKSSPTRTGWALGSCGCSSESSTKTGETRRSRRGSP